MEKEEVYVRGEKETMGKRKVGNGNVSMPEYSGSGWVESGARRHDRYYTSRCLRRPSAQPSMSSAQVITSVLYRGFKLGRVPAQRIDNVGLLRCGSKL